MATIKFKVAGVVGLSRVFPSFVVFDSAVCFLNLLQLVL